MHTWRGIGILVIFATIGRKRESPCARDAETHIRTRAAARDSAKDRQTTNFDNLR